MRQDVNFLTVGTDGRVYYTKPGIATAVSGLTNMFYFYLQSGAVFRIVRDPASTATYCRVYASDGNDTVWMTLTFDFSLTAWCDLTEPLRSLVDRAIPVNTPAPAGTAGITVGFEMYDNTDALLSSISLTARIIDCLDYSFEDTASPWWPGVPEVIRLPYGGSPRITLPTMGDSGEMTTVVKVYYNSTLLYSATLDNIGCPVTMLNTGNLIVMESGSGEVCRTRIEIEDCSTDTLALTWWSPELGGWKTAAAKIVSAGVGNDNLSEFDREFGHHSAGRGRQYLRCRFPLLTLREWMWYRDIALSDEVIVSADRYVAPANVMTEFDSALILNATNEVWKPTDCKDLTFDVCTMEAWSL